MRGDAELIIGKKVESGENLKINLSTLIDTRLLIQANSGGGKSYLIRKILEESHGKVQQIVLDLEGEFNSLREKYDYLLIGKEGEIPANIRTAEVLARKLLELNVSAIVDLSDLKYHERILFVKRFLDSMINSPKNLWHPCLVIIDEAHIFCPEKTKSESASSVIDIMTRGRKRGFCGVLATQRISKLHKDAAAEANNKLVGRTGLDIDMKRAADDLGFTSKEQMRSLRDLEAGEFFAFGAAMSREVTKVKIDAVKTNHPKSGGRQLIKVSPTPQNIKKILNQVVDLQKDADEEMKTKQDMERKINDLNREIRSLKLQKPKAEIDEKEIKKRVDTQLQQAIKIISKDAEAEMKRFATALYETKKVFQKISAEATRMAERIPEEVQLPEYVVPTPHRDVVPRLPDKIPSIYNNFGKCEKSIYSFLYANQNREFSIAQIAAMTGYSANSGGFNNALSKLNTAELISRNRGKISLKTIDISLVEKEENFSIELIKRKLGKCEREIFEVVLENPSSEFTIEELASHTASNYSPSSGGFNNSLSKLNSIELIIRERGKIRLNKEIKEMI